MILKVQPLQGNLVFWVSEAEGYLRELQKAFLQLPLATVYCCDIAAKTKFIDQVSKRDQLG